MREYTVVQGTVSLVLKVLSDVNYPGTFHPDAPSDNDYFGFRETEYEVERATLHMGLAGDVDLDESEINNIIMKHNPQITRSLQWMIDQEDRF